LKGVQLTENAAMKERAAVISIGVKVLLAFGKLVAGLLSGSLALLSEAANNIGDIAIVSFSYIAIRQANKPADDNHHYGHAKIEALAALAQTAFLLGLAAYISVTAIRQLVAGEPTNVVPTALSFGVLIVSMIVDFTRWRSLDKVAKLTKSEALAADALNFASDIVAAGFALVGLAAVSFGYWRGDAIGALGVAAFITYAGVGLARRTVDVLTDTAPPGLSESITSISKNITDVIGVDALRLRPSGEKVLGDVSIVIARTLPLERVTAIKDKLKAAVASKHPEVSLTIADRPIALDEESIVERVFLTAAKRRIPIHHLTVQQLEGRISISFDVEIDGRMTHGSAHKIVTALEADIRGELGADTEVDSHMEPLEPRELAGHNASEEIRCQIAAMLTRQAAATGDVSDIHDVRVRETPCGLIVNYHCRVGPDLTVLETHNRVNAIDHMMLTEYANIARIVGHADPAWTKSAPIVTDPEAQPCLQSGPGLEKNPQSANAQAAQGGQT
jgi:cation diffusion facilitator family transporter